MYATFSMCDFFIATVQPLIDQLSCMVGFFSKLECNFYQK